MDRWLNKSRNTVGSSSSDANENKCVTPNNSASLKRANSPPNKQSDTGTSATTVSKRRKYDENYISFGFIHENSYPQCVVCSKVFPNSSMVPAKLRRHLETNHTNVKDKPVDYFIRLRDQLLKNKNFIAEVTKTENEKATEASYMVSYRIAQAGKAHTIAENLIKPCVNDIVSCMLDEKAVKKINTIPLSNDTVRRRINDISTHIKSELISRLKCNNFALQMDESTDVSGLAVLLVFVRYKYQTSLEEDLLLCQPLSTYTTGYEIFNMLNNFFEIEGLTWDNCIDICTDGAKAMVGKTAGVVSRIKEVTNNCSNSHCIFHRQALAIKKMPIPLKNVLDEAVKIINFVKSRPLSTRLFTILCEDMGSMHKSLLYHTEIRWLSRGKTLVRLLELRNELYVFFTDHPFNLQLRLSDKIWLFRLSYLADIFTKLNEVNLSIQESIDGNIEDFDEIYGEIEQHLNEILSSLEKYFPESKDIEFIQRYNWVKNPFLINDKPEDLSITEYEEFIEMTTDSSLKTLFDKISLTDFWCSSSITNEYQSLAKKAILALLPFATTYLCETGFSSYASMKTKYRNKLDAEADMRIQLSPIKPNIKILVNKKSQHHGSH
ncbi:unnamed protein product [Macrosiphum euphorbiae]|uniref:Zinc finger BED domain-containing protein 5 n=1 Tax=Macrosiphum euphorbiae TaxID=13131 RepID=A0AAV0VLC4_9HEMI|nr:unnamed protein product [Macrosiphum euphorbiae]